MPDKFRLVSMNKVTYGNFGKRDMTTHPVILAERTKWHHFLRDRL